MNTTNADSGKSRAFSGKPIVAAAIWLALIAWALASVAKYSASEGRSGVAPPEWPDECRFERAPNLPTLIVFFHPHCPCSRASLGELERLLAECGKRVRTFVAFPKLEGTPEDWTQTALWRRAASIPGVQVVQDDSGAEALRFAAETSGVSLLYDAGGKLVFYGGITQSRGHSGDNAGRDALKALLQGKIAQRIDTPVFGCPIQEEECDGSDSTRASAN